MAYRIDIRDGYHEITVSGATSRAEIVSIIKELSRLDPRKARADLWIIDAGSQIPLSHFADIAQTVSSLLPSDAIGNKTALVAANQLHLAQLSMYKVEAEGLPFPMRLFLSRQEAVDWLTE